MQIKTYDNRYIDFNIPHHFSGTLVALPALIDPHVHFRIPGAIEKEDWITGTHASLAGGYSTVFDMPNNNPPIIDVDSFGHKEQLIKEMTEMLPIKIHHKLWFGATPNNLLEIEKLTDKIVGIKVFMGSSTGNLLVDKLHDQERIFELASRLGLVVGVHAEHEETINAHKQKYTTPPQLPDHSKIRDTEVATKAVTQALELAQKHGTKLYILHTSTHGEIELIRQAKKDGINVHAEVTPHHLFLNQDAYVELGTKAQMNPPLRTSKDQEALWEGIADGTIDTIGTDHAPHTLEQKDKPYGEAPSGVPGIETALPLLLDAHNRGLISLEKIVELTRTNIEKIFPIEKNNDWTIVDLNLKKEVRNEDLKTKCGWSPFHGTVLTGWPIYTLIETGTNVYTVYHS